MENDAKGRKSPRRRERAIRRLPLRQLLPRSVVLVEERQVDVASCVNEEQVHEDRLPPPELDLIVVVVTGTDAQIGVVTCWDVDSGVKRVVLFELVVAADSFAVGLACCR